MGMVVCVKGLKCLMDSFFLHVAQLRWNMQGDGGLCEGIEMLDGVSLYVAQLR